MAWNYRRRIKVIPGVYLNFSKSGISTSVGVKGASITFSKSGTYLNQSIPFLGIYNRQKISHDLNRNVNEITDPNNIQNQLEVDNSISSSNIENITSQDMQGIKDSIISAHNERIELKKDLKEVKSALNKSKNKLLSSYILLYGFIKKSIPEKIKDDILLQEESITDLENQLENCYVNLEIEFDSEISEKYNMLVTAFKDLSNSEKIWDVTNSTFHDSRITRSYASTFVDKVEVNFTTKSIPEIKSTYEALYLQNANGADFYFYPYFIIMYSNETNFAVIGLDEIKLKQRYVSFTENDSVPSDSKIIKYTWSKVNKDGSPDRRFNGNYQIPVVKYGEITIKSDLGLNEEYEFSNYESSEKFSKVFIDYQNTIKSLKNINSSEKLVETNIKKQDIIQTKDLAKIPIINLLESEPLEIKNKIFDTEATIVDELNNEIGKITKLSGQIGQSEIKLFLALEDWKKFSLEVIPTLSIEIKVNKNLSFLIITSSNKDISPLKKGDLFTIYFNDESYIQKKFENGRNQFGKNVVNYIFFSDLELISLYQNTVKFVETFSGLKIPYEFTDIKNHQYSNSLEGQKLFQIMCIRITGVKLILKKQDDTQ